MDATITIIDYGVGNLASVVNMVRKAGGIPEVTGELDKIRRASRLLLPGVGAFDACRAALDARAGLVETIMHKAGREGCPTLGICVGMQLLADGSEEGTAPGLGLIHGRARRFDFSGLPDQHVFKIPHMGWSVIKPSATSRLFAGADDRLSRFYFVHSYHVVCADPQEMSASATYGVPFAAAVERDNVFGVQFHPEKSHSAGLEFFKRFLRVCQPT